MIRVGKAIRENFHWVPMHEKAYLFIDSADGHGTNEAINAYDMNLMIDFNVKLIFKVPRIPYSNVLDLLLKRHIICIDILMIHLFDQFIKLERKDN